MPPFKRLCSILLFPIIHYSIPPSPPKPSRRPLLSRITRAPHDQLLLPDSRIIPSSLIPGARPAKLTSWRRIHARRALVLVPRWRAGRIVAVLGWWHVSLLVLLLLLVDVLVVLWSLLS